MAFLGCAALAWSAVAYKAAAVRRDPRNPALWALTFAIALPSAGFTMMLPPVVAAITDVTGVENLASLLTYICIVGYSVAALIMLMLWHLPAEEARRRSRRLLLFFGAVIAAMTALFAWSGAGAAPTADFDDTFGPQPAGGTFLLVYVTAFGIGLSIGAYRGLQFARRVATTAPDHPWLRRGLRLVATGSLTALGYCAGKAAFVLTAWTTAARIHALNDIATACACVGAITITVGFTIPSWGSGLTRAAGWPLRARRYLQLYPLWHELYRAIPSIALDPPASRIADLAMLRDLDYRLYRRVVEIRDGLLALQELPAHADRHGNAVGSTGGSQPVAVLASREAARVRAALHAGGMHEPSAGSSHASGDARSSSAAELKWLAAVSVALRNLPGDTSRTW
ncbi:MAB_1171c family putative transporter [Dactylosporangium sp. CA-139114]|uniref:MAB_1171c family putative transporter n=1 Tax=Dactylosporangium sp. CA-139114 TaxID=3239931 RepID=UPI003D97CFEF